MRCDLHCPEPAGTLRAPLLALAALAAVSVAVYVASLLGGVLVAALAMVMALNVAGIVVFVRRYVRRPQPRIRVTLRDGRLGAELVAGERLAIAAPKPVAVVLARDGVPLDVVAPHG